MNGNDMVLSENVLAITLAARKLDQLLRDGKIRELELVLGTVNDSSTRAIYRCMDIIYDRNPAKAVYGG